MWKFAASLVFFISTASAGVDEQFPEGALGLSWGASLQQVQAAHPGGLAWPVKGEYEGVAYVITDKPRVLGSATAVKLVQFLFTNDNKLRTIFFHFAYADRETAIYDLGEMLGHDYFARDVATGRKLRWKSAKATDAQFEIGQSPLQPWAVLALQARDVAPGTRR